MREITLALGGGGIRGIAHIGVIKKLQEKGFIIKGIAGTSAGSLVGALIAAGHSPDELIEILLSLKSDLTFPLAFKGPPSILSNHILSEGMTALLGQKEFNNLQIPFACTAVDLKTSRRIVLNHGKLINSILASSAFPGVFPPIDMDELQLVDGGILDPVPVTVARKLAPEFPVVAVTLSPQPQDWGQHSDVAIPTGVALPIPQPIIKRISKNRFTKTMQIFLESMDVISKSLAELRLAIDKPDVILRPNVHHVGILDRVDIQELVAAGEASVMEKLEELKDLSGASNV